MGHETPRRHCIGRVGALAVALGIGGAVVSLPVVASAETREDANSTSQAPDPGPAVARHSRGPRTASSNSAESPSGAGRGSATPDAADGTAAGPAAADRSQRTRTSLTPKPAVSGSDPSAPRVSVDVPTVQQDSMPTPAVDPQTPPAPPAGESIASPATAAALPGSPVMVAATPRAALAAADNPLARLGGGADPSAPLAVPFAWAVLAVSRRELAGNLSAGAPAASVTSGQSGVTSALVAAAKQVILAVAGGAGTGTALRDAVATLNADPAFQAAYGSVQSISFSALVADPGALGDTVKSLVTGLAGDSAVRAAIRAELSEYVTESLGNLPGAAGIGATVGDAVAGLLADPAAANGLGAVAKTIVTAALAQPGVGTALVGAAQQIVNGLGGQNPNAVLDAAWESLRSAPAFQSAVGPTVNAAVQTLLTDAGLVNGLGGAVTEIVSGVGGTPAIQALVGGQVAAYVNSVLAADPALAGAVNDALAGLIADPAVINGLASVAGSVLTGFIGQPGVVTAVSTIAGQFATVVVQGTDPQAALYAAVQALQANSAVKAALAATAAGAAQSLLTNADLISALASTTTALVGDVAGIPSVWNSIAAVVGPTYSDAILSILADPQASARLATLAGSLLTGFVAQPGVVGALSQAAGDITAALLGGADPAAVLTGALRALQVDPAIAAALDAAVSTATRAILGDPVAREAIQVVTRGVVVDLIDDAVGDGLLGGALNEVANAAVDSLLGNAAVQALIGQIAGDIAAGNPVELTDTLIKAVISQPALQAALGAAVGEGVGALLGDNIVGSIVGSVVGAAATILIGLASGIAGLFNLFGSAASSAASVGDSDSWFYLVGYAPTLTV